MSKYNQGPIPLEIQEDLAQAFRCKSLSELKGARLMAALQQINEKLKKHKIRQPVFTARSLQRYFSNGNIRLDNLQALLLFLDRDTGSVSFDKKKSKHPRAEPCLKNLSGKWYSYVYESEERSVRRTVLFLTQVNKYFEVYYRGINDVFTGKAEIIRNSIFFHITSEDREIKISLCAELPDTVNRSEPEQYILNVYCLANSRSGRPVISNVVMVKADQQDADTYSTASIEQFKRTEPVRLVYQDLSSSKTAATPGSTIEQWKEREIIVYLSRNYRVNKKLRGFSPNTFDHIKERNNIADERNSRENFHRLKVKLNGYTGYAFSRYRQKGEEVAMFSYTFRFIDEERKCLAFRHPIGIPGKDDFKGEVVLKGEKIYMHLMDPNLQRQRLLIAPFNCERNAENDSFVFRGVAATISSQTAQPIALRELILCMKDDRELQGQISEDDKINNYISYECFRDLAAGFLRDEEKLYLANEFASTLVFPDAWDPHFSLSRQDMAREFAGDYTVFLFASDLAPIKLMLTLDRLAQATLRTPDESDGKTYTYHGVAECYAHVLRISVHFGTDNPNEYRHAHLLSDRLRENNPQRSIIQGVYLASTDEKKARASRCIMIRVEPDDPETSFLQPGWGSATRDELMGLKRLINEKYGLGSLELHAALDVSR